MNKRQKAILGILSFFVLALGAYHALMFNSYYDCIYDFERIFLPLGTWYERWFAVNVFKNELNINNDLPSFYVEIGKDKLRALSSDLPKSKDYGQSAKLVHDGKTYEIDLSLRGDTNWHWQFEKKSYKISLNNGRMINNHESVLLVNPKSGHGLEEIRNLELARHLNLLVPDKRYAHLFINDEYQGLYLWYEPFDENFFRSNRLDFADFYKGDNHANDRLPGSEEIYIYRDIDNWKYSDVLFEKDLFIKLFDQISRVVFFNEPLAELHQLADVEYFSRLCALISFTQSLHIDILHNVYLKFDENTGKFIQIPWDISYGAPTSAPDIVSNELFLALHKDPAFIYGKYQIFDKLLNQDKIVEKLLAKIDQTAETVRPSFNSDNYKATGYDGRKYLNNQDFEQKMQEVKRTLLSRDEIDSKIHRAGVKFSVKGSKITVFVDDWSSVRIQNIEYENDCRVAGYIPDKNLNALPDDGIRSLSDISILHPGRTDEYLSYNMPFLAPAALAYTIFWENRDGEQCRIKEIEFANALSGEEVIAERVEDDSGIELSEFSFHPWQIEMDRAEYEESSHSGHGEYLLKKTPDGTEPRLEREYKFSLDKAADEYSLSEISRDIRGILESSVADRNIWQAGQAIGQDYYMDAEPEEFVYRDIYFDTEDDLAYKNDISYRLRNRFNTAKDYEKNIDNFQNDKYWPIRIEIQAKVGRKELGGGFSQVSESRFEFRAESLPFSAENPPPGQPWDLDKFIGYLESGRFKEYYLWPARAVTEYLLSEYPSRAQFEFFPKLVAVTARFRQHLNLKTDWGSGPNPEQAFIITIDRTEVYKADEYLDYVRNRKLSLEAEKPEKIGRFTEIEVEFERNVSTELDKAVAAAGQANDQAEENRLKRIASLFQKDQTLIMELIARRLNEMGIKAEPAGHSKYWQAYKILSEKIYEVEKL